MKSQLTESDLDPFPMKKKRRDAISDIECPMNVKWSNITRAVKGDGIAKANRPVKVTSTFLEHNHNLNKKFLLKSKIAAKEYSISIPVARKILEMMDSGPLPTKTLRCFLQKQVPSYMKISSTMVFNDRAKAKMLRRKFGADPAHFPTEEVRRVFHENSLKNAPSDWASEQIYADVYKESMIEVLSGEGGNETLTLLLAARSIVTMIRRGFLSCDGFRHILDMPQQIVSSLLLKKGPRN